MNQLRDYEDETAATALSAHAPFVVECLRDYAQLLRDGTVDGAGRYFPAEIDATADRIEAGAQPAEPTVPITARYTNWRGETRERVFIPLRVYFGSNEWHPEPQVLIDAIDCETGNARTFAAAGFAAPGAEPVAGHDMKSPFMFDGPIHRVSAKTTPSLGGEMPTASLAEGELPSFSDDIDMAWTELCLTGRDHTSPAEYPDMRLITRDELAEFMSRRMPPAPAAEPVMWRFRFLSNGEPGGWYFTMEPPRETGNRSAEYQALYTAPPVANGRRDRYRRAAEFAAKMAWREDPPNAHQNLTESERLSAIKYHPDIKALAAAPTEAGRDE